MTVCVEWARFPAPSRVAPQIFICPGKKYFLPGFFMWFSEKRSAYEAKKGGKTMNKYRDFDNYLKEYPD